MRILLFCNSWVGWKILQYLRAQGEDIAGVVMHPPDKQNCGPEIIAAGGSCIVDASLLNEPQTAAIISELKPRIGVSAFFGYILKRPILDLLPLGCVNLHPALLPYNRGAHPNVWSIAEGTPAGVTLHYIDQGVDTGDIIAQTPVPSDPTDTGETLYRKLERASVDLFVATWPRIRNGEVVGTPQTGNGGTSHRVRDLERLAEIDLDSVYTGRRLLDVIRSQTFPPYSGAWFRHNGRKIFMRISFIEEE